VISISTDLPPPLPVSVEFTQFFIFLANLRFAWWKVWTKLPSTLSTHLNANWLENENFSSDVGVDRPATQNDDKTFLNGPKKIRPSYIQATHRSINFSRKKKLIYLKYFDLLPFSNNIVSNISSESLLRRGTRIWRPELKSLSTGPEEGRGVLYLRKTSLTSGNLSRWAE